MVRRKLLKRRYYVERLCAIRRDPLNDKREVLVKWRNYSIAAATWEPFEQLLEDGLGPMLGALINDEDSSRRRFIFVVRFHHTIKAPRNIYRRLANFLAIGGESVDRITGNNAHLMFDMPEDQVAIFTDEFRRWLDSIAPAGCAHAHLFKLASDDDAVLRVYPPIT